MENKNYSFDGFIGLFDNYFPEQYITDIIKWFNTIDKAGLVQSTKSYTSGHENDMDETQLIEYPLIHDIRQPFIRDFFDIIWRDVWPEYTKEFSILLNRQFQGEGLKMKRIKPGGGFHNWHFESTDVNVKRKLVLQLYLNDIDEAGETEFLYQNKRLAPKKNRLLIFPADFTYTHRGNPPIGKTDKYILTTWLEEKY
tara:strand:+ start:5158 stop:5748 length:591 start_codon:yes stop_codon:yes gene_type:complete